MKLRTLFAAASLVALAASASAQPISAQAVATARLPNGIATAANGPQLQVAQLTDSIIRVRIAKAGQFPEDASWAVPAAVRRQSVAVSAGPDGFQTKAIAVHLNLSTLGITVTDLEGETIVADAPGALRFDGRGFTLRKALPIDQHIFALGDKTGPLDRRGSTFLDWNTA